ncbi:hypothetical protein GLOTRDRAFT_124558 [Gloeophyllum trabeum ATCC 11539]|uniref:Secreted protein n=1 Tax=Gloeophyllum trabeum (strain ATCC 11539 / FP-39264 / Madison 617) TaxID=670483 RepID=S7S4H0_GLOTA|nr:uncharacterized protein GLOTRDRAFT_124558 [Gloeophyllum trabeum ATCC 11539]EPQ60809.1 hypothetical protein GLOTRDRAFT_124558 [Gloeophyllum trabeum ATCC 11539]
MPSLARILLVALPALVLHAVATPMPFPLLRAADYRQQDVPSRVGTVKTYRIRRTTTIQESTHTELERALQTAPLPSHAASPEARDVNVVNVLGDLNLLNNYYLAAQGNSENLRKYAAQSASRSEDDGTFQRQCASELTSFHTNMQGYYTVLARIASDKGLDKGLANYDRQNDLETSLKDVVNLNKDTLQGVTVLVYNIPSLGPVLGPIVYEVKCLVDAVLDATENLTDAIINAIQPLLQDLLGQATDTMCSTGVDLAGLCI